jgi:pimeloyl-ACP methyl ester carboxylesterase
VTETQIEAIEVGVGKWTFSCRVAGPPDGRLVILLHGFPQTSWSWRHQLAALGAGGYRVVAPDQRGYSPGARPEGVEHYAVEHLIADVLGIADEMGGHEFDLVGHDWGGAVAWYLAGRYPARVRTLTVVSTPHPLAFAGALADSGDQQQRSTYVTFFRQEGNVAELAMLADDAQGLRNLYQGSGLTPEDAEEYLGVLTQPGALTGALNYYRATGFDQAAAIGPVTAPTMYVWSTDDVALGRDAAEATGQFVEGPYRFEVLDGVSHWIPEHAPDALNDLLLAHLDG